MSKPHNVLLAHSYLGTIPRSHIPPTNSVAAHDSYSSLDHVCRITQLTPEMVMAWEDRFHLLQAQRDAAGRRRYAEHHIQRLMSLKKLICDEGILPRQVAAVLDHPELMSPEQAAAKIALASTQRFLATIRKVEETLATPLEHVVDAPERVMDVIAEVLKHTRELLGAYSVQCWLDVTTDAPMIIGPSSLAGKRLLEVRKLVQHVMTDQQPVFRCNQRLGTFVAYPVRLGTNVQGVLTIARDQLQRLTAEEKHAVAIIAAQLGSAISAARFCAKERSSDEYWRAILDAMPDAVMIRDSQHRIIYMNRTALDLAANRDAIIAARQQGTPEPRPIWDTVMPGGEEPRMDELPSLRAITEQAKIASVRMDLYTPAVEGVRQMIPVLISAAPLIDHQGKVRHSVVIVQDITTTRAIEKLKETFVKRFVHDNNAPLAALLLAGEFVELQSRKCQEQLQPTIPPFYTRLLDMIRRSAQSIVQCGKDIQHSMGDLSNMQDVAIGVPARMSLFDLVDARVREMRTIYGKKRFYLEADAADTRLEGNWHKLDIECIFNNLLENAVKYSPEHAPITVRLYKEIIGDEPIAHLVVEDRGFGIDPDEIEHVFDEKFRASKIDYQGREIHGTGMGLHFCQNLVKLYNGFLYAKSDGMGQGSQFHLRLPLAD